jgi:hypothetical protein
LGESGVPRTDRQPLQWSRDRILAADKLGGPAHGEHVKDVVRTEFGSRGQPRSETLPDGVCDRDKGSSDGSVESDLSVPLMNETAT